MKKPILTPELQEKIESLGNKGIPDSKIAKELHLKNSLVTQVTTKYWERKMEEKNG